MTHYNILILADEDVSAVATLLQLNDFSDRSGCSLTWTQAGTLHQACQLLVQHRFSAVVAILGLRHHAAMESLVQLRAAVPNTALVILAAESATASMPWTCERQFVDPLTQWGEAQSSLPRMLLQAVARRRVLSQLRRGASVFDAVIQYAADALFTVNFQQIIQTNNRAAERLFGYAPAEVAGESLAILFPREKRLDEMYLLLLLTACGGNRTGLAQREIFACTKDGRQFTADLCITEITDRDTMETERLFCVAVYQRDCAA